jgi:archaemetzincin
VREIILWWIGADAADTRLLEDVRRGVEREFDAPARAHVPAERPEHAFDARRGQHSSGRILEWLSARRPEDASRILGLTDADLFIPILTFVFGEAQLRGRVAVVSTARLSAAPGLPGQTARLAVRLRTEAIHELGHTFGLLHCRDALCAMARSTSLRDVDTKRPTLCRECRARYLESSDTIGEPHEQEKHPDPDRR